MVLVPVKDARQWRFVKDGSRRFTQIVRNPKLLAVSLMPNIETPSVVAKQRFDRESDVYSLPKYLHTIANKRYRIALYHVGV